MGFNFSVECNVACENGNMCGMKSVEGSPANIHTTTIL